MCNYRGYKRQGEKPKDITQQRTPATTQWPRYRKSRLFAISHRIFCVWLYFCSIRVTWFPLDYPITNIMWTLWLTLEGVAVLFRRNVRWVLDTGVHRVRYENATIIVVDVFFITILSFEVLPFYHIKVIFCKLQKCMLNVCMLTETYPLM